MFYEDVARPVVLRHQDMWAAYTGCRQYIILMRYPLSSRANELLAMNRLRLKAAVGLLTQPCELICTNLDIENGKNAGCVNMIKDTVYTLFVTVLP
jgi:hypothetical protein